MAAGSVSAASAKYHRAARVLGPPQLAVDLVPLLLVERLTKVRFPIVRQAYEAAGGEGGLAERHSAGPGRAAELGERGRRLRQVVELQRVPLGRRRPEEVLQQGVDERRQVFLRGQEVEVVGDLVAADERQDGPLAHGGEKQGGGGDEHAGLPRRDDVQFALRPLAGPAQAPPPRRKELVAEKGHAEQALLKEPVPFAFQGLPGRQRAHDFKLHDGIPCNRVFYGVPASVQLAVCSSAFRRLFRGIPPTKTMSTWCPGGTTNESFLSANSITTLRDDG